MCELNSKVREYMPYWKIGYYGDLYNVKINDARQIRKYILIGAIAGNRHIIYNYLFEDFRDSSLICSIAALFGRVSLYARLTECPTFDDLFLAIIGGELDMVKHIYARCFSKKKMPIALACLALRNNHTHILNWMFEIGYLDRIGYTSNARFVYKDAAMYGAEWSMRWILDLPNVVVPIEYRMYSLISPRWLSKMNGRWINNIFYDMRDGEFRELARWTREPTNIIPECGEFVVDDWSFITTPVAYAYISNIPNVKLY